MIKEVHGGNIYKFDHRVYDFSANLNPLGMPPEVKQALIDHIDQYESYPDPWNRELTAALSRYHGVPEDRICCGNGAADIIFRTALALKPKKALIVSPTFSEYGQALETAGCQIRSHLLREEKGFRLDRSVLADIDGELDMVFLCNPNNPTGIPAERELVLAMAEKCRQAGAVLMVDECFSEFLMEEEKYSIMADIAGLPQVVILKAFTKIFAMAGLRLGYCVCGDSGLCGKIAATLQPWAVSTPASKAGTAALQVAGTGFVERTKAYVDENRRFLTDGLKALGYRVYDGKANYVFFRSDTDLSGPLMEEDIVIRSCANYESLDQRYFRIAVRTREENTYFLQCLRKITERNGGTYDGKKEG